MQSLLETWPLHLYIGTEDVSWLIDQGVTFSNVDPGGYETASFPIPKDMPKTMVGQAVRLDSGLGVAWEGRVSEVQRSLGNRTLITCEGYGATLKETLLSMVYVDRDLTHWTQPSLSRQIGNGLTANGSTSFEVVPDTANGQPALILRLTSQGAGINTSSEAWYDSGSENLIAVVYYNQNPDSGSTNLQSVLELCQTDTSLNESAGNVHGASGYFAPGTSYRYAMLQLYDSGNTSGAEQAGTWKQLAVYGNHGLTRRGSDPGGFYTSDIAKHAISMVSSVVAGIIPDATAYIVPHYVQYQPVSIETIIADMAKFAGVHWGTWENLNYMRTATPRVDFRPYPTAATASCLRENCDTLDLHEQLANLYDTAQIHYTDQAGLAQAVSVTVDNPYLDAVSLHRTVDLQGGTLTSAAGTSFGQMVLALLQQQARVAGTAVFLDPVKTIGGAPMPAFMLKSGIDRLRINDLPGSNAFGTHNDFNITRVECRVGEDGISTSVELGTGANLIETLSARLQEAAQVLGL